MFIEKIQYQLGKTNFSIDNLAELNEISSEDAIVFKKLMGLKTIPRDFKSTVITMMIDVLNKLFSHSDTDKNKIKYILFSHTSEFIAPFGFFYLKKIADYFNITQAKYFSSSAYKCATTFQHIKLSHAIIKTMQAEDRILILTCDITFSNILKTISGVAIMGDSITAILLKKEGLLNQYIDSHHIILGEYAKGIWDTAYHLNFFQSQYISELSNLVYCILSKNKMTYSNIKFIFPHNVNSISWKTFSKKTFFPLDKIYLKNIARTSHCFGSDPWINLQDAMSEKLMIPGDYYLLVTVGLGATFSVLLFRY